MTGSATGRVRAIALGLMAAALCAGPALAQPALDTAPLQAAPACCRLPEGTVVAVQLVTPIRTEEARSGDTFPLKLAAPVVIDGQVLLPAGTPGVGRVVQASKPGIGGKGAKLVVAAEYLTVRDGAVPLKALQLGAIGKDESLTANASSIGGLVFMPLGLIGFAVKGGDIEIPAGTAATAKVGRSTTLFPVALATPQDILAARIVSNAAKPPPGSFVLPDPPAGMGQIVFFRQHTVLGTAQWFNVRDEGGQALGKLDNGAFFVVPVPAGQHSFTAKTEPEFTDMLTLQIDPGENYYVEGVLTKGVLIGVPNLTPSDRSRFEAASAQMHAVPNAGQATASR